MASRRTANSHKMHLFCRVLLFTLITTGGTYAMSIPFSTIQKGSSSGIKEPIQQVIRTAEEFDSFWGPGEAWVQLTSASYHSRSRNRLFDEHGCSRLRG
jgi:hypothetical protein